MLRSACARAQGCRPFSTDDPKACCRRSLPPGARIAAAVAASGPAADTTAAAVAAAARCPRKCVHGAAVPGQQAQHGLALGAAAVVADAGDDADGLEPRDKVPQLSEAAVLGVGDLFVCCTGHVCCKGHEGPLGRGSECLGAG